MKWSKGIWWSRIDDGERTEAVLAINLNFNYEGILNKPYIKLDVKEKGEKINWFRSIEILQLIQGEKSVKLWYLGLIFRYSG